MKLDQSLDVNVAAAGAAAQLAARPKCRVKWGVLAWGWQPEHKHRCVVFLGHLSQHLCSCGSTRAAAKGKK